MEATTYRFGEVRKADPSDNRTVEFIISNENKDRHGTIIPLKAWNLDNYNRNPIVGYQHNLYGDALCTPPNPDDVIGKSEVFIEDGQLIGRVTFEPAEINPLAEKIYQKVLFGTLRTASVGFIDRAGTYYGDGEEGKGQKNQTEYFKDVELLEWSIVNIPSNPTAGKREFSIQTERALRYIVNLTGGKITVDEIKEMPVSRVIELVRSISTDTSLERDFAEYDNEIKQAEKVKQELKIKQHLEQLDLELKLRSVGVKNKEDK